MIRQAIFTCFTVLLLTDLTAQVSGPRLFLDIPAVFATSPNVEKIGNNAGLGLETALNVGTHWSVVRFGGGAAFTVDPKSNELGETFSSTPFFILEGGVGKYRSNGNKCARTHRPAYTALLKAGLRYDLYTGKVADANEAAGRLDYTLGVEFGNFYIRDIFKNYEIFLRSNYLLKSKVIMADFGFKVFLNLKADRDR